MESRKTISVRSVTLTSNGLFSSRRYHFIDTVSLVDSLHVIKGCAVEEHTKNNIQTLINQLVGLRTTV